jgi:hypothetical protein
MIDPSCTNLFYHSLNLLISRHLLICFRAVFHNFYEFFVWWVGRINRLTYLHVVSILNHTEIIASQFPCWSYRHHNLHTQMHFHKPVNNSSMLCKCVMTSQVGIPFCKTCPCTVGSYGASSHRYGMKNYVSWFPTLPTEGLTIVTCLEHYTTECLGNRALLYT